MNQQIKRILFAAAFLAVSVSYSFSEPYDAFDFVLNGIYNDSGDPKLKEKLAQKYLDAFTKDIGQAISGGSYGIGGNLGISGLNMTLSLKVSVQDVSNDNIIVKTTGDSTIIYPILQAEFGFMERFDAIGRISYGNRSTVLGGGLRYTILKSEDEMYIPTVSVQSVYNYLIANDNEYGKFNAWNLKNGVTAYFGLIPYIQPYVFLTYDFTALKPVSSSYSYLSSKADGIGYGAGANVKLEMLNLSFSVSMYESRPNYNFGIFISI